VQEIGIVGRQGGVGEEDKEREGTKNRRKEILRQKEIKWKHHRGKEIKFSIEWQKEKVTKI
jgi:hypothetical protein